MWMWFYCWALPQIGEPLFVPDRSPPMQRSALLVSRKRHSMSTGYVFRYRACESTRKCLYRTICLATLTVNTFQRPCLPDIAHLTGTIMDAIILTISLYTYSQQFCCVKGEACKKG